MRIIASSLVVVAVFAPQIARGQDDFSHIKAKVGQQVVVTEDGLSTSGRVTDLSATSMKVGDREIRPGPGLKIERDNGNTLARGMLVGAAIVGGLAAAATPDAHVGGAVVGGASGAFWGALFGAVQDRRTAIYDTTAVGVPANAQLSLPPVRPTATAPGFARLHVARGQRVFVTDGGVTVSGIVTGVKPDTLSAGGRDFKPAAGLKIEKEGDPVWDGAAYGFMIGALAATTVGSEACLHEPMWHCAVGGGLEFAGIGALLDWAHKGRTTIYDPASAPEEGAGATIARHLVPILSTHERALAMRFNLR
jgi:hypothetical protein